MSKAILKDVREAIKAEKYEDAIKKCEDLLKNEPKCYMAYLLLGAAYQNSNKTEAAKHLRKAVEYSPSAPTVALQGLANCAPVEELPKIYEQLIELVPEKYNDYYEKIFVLSSNAIVTQNCWDIFKREAKNSNETRQKAALNYLARISVGQDLNVSDDDEQLLIEALEETIKDEKLNLHLQCYKRYLKLLFKQKAIENCLTHACLLIEFYPNDIYAYEWICKIYCENYNNPAAHTWWTALKNPIDFYAKGLLQLNANSGLALLIDAIRLNEQEQFVAARDQLERVLNIQTNYSPALELYAHAQMKLGAYTQALQSWQKLGKYEKEYAECLSHSDDKDKLNAALEILQKIEKNDAILLALARCYFKLGQLDKLKEASLTFLAKAEYLTETKAAISILKSSEYSETFDALLLLGKLLYKESNFTEALTYILKATRLRPYRSDCFYYLGKIYYETQDVVRSRKCFEKCVNLNPVCEDAINNLSAIYQHLGEENINEALLLTTLKYLKNENSKNIHYKLGLHYLSVKKCDDAIQSFRIAIKFDVTCMNYWESLGDAYSERGSYNSAIRVFQKILELDPPNIYAKLQMATLKTIIRMYPEAIEDFDKLLKEHPDYLPGLKGIAEAHIGLAYNLKLEHCYGRSKFNLQQAINYLQRVFLTPDNHKMIWLWRLTANVFVQVAQLPNSMANLEVSGKLAKRETEIEILDRSDLFQLATRFYTCALKLKQNTFLWYELALCSYYRANYLSTDTKAHLDLALKACQMSIEEQNDRWQNWNLLGVINMHEIINDYPMAQHSFVQALQLERKSYTTWTNLGVLYLKLGDIKLANQAFQRAQQSSPIYPNAWIGQAMIAEAIGEEEEALDLFRHCQQFEYHAESSLGYAHWVCRILTDAEKCQQPHYRHAIKNMYADIVALDAINWYTRTEEENASIPALSFEGFLSERQKLYTTAVRSYSRAAQKSPAGVERDVLNTSLGYIYLKLNQPLNAIKAFNSVSHASFKPIIGLALAYYRADQHQEAYSVYNSVLKSVAGTEDDKAAMILVAMASMVYASQGEADTKTILYQCILLKDSPIQALYSACSLGILHHDRQLSETILSELKKHENNIEHCAHIAYLTAQYYVANQQSQRGLTYLISRIHIFPNCAELRMVLANYLLDNFAQMRKYQLATSQVALSAIIMGHSNRQHKSSCLDDSKALLIASRALEPVDKTRSLKLIQRSIHLNPQNTNAWNALLKAR